MIGIHEALAEHWPACAEDLTPEVRFAVEATQGMYSMEARHKIERRRVEVNRAMSRLFEQVDLVITASNPDVAFGADGPLPDTFGGVHAGVHGAPEQRLDPPVAATGGSKIPPGWDECGESGEVRRAVRG